MATQFLNHEFSHMWFWKMLIDGEDFFSPIGGIKIQNIRHFRIQLQFKQ